MKKTQITNNKNGGAKLGQGSYGCVISPPVKCLTKKLLRKNKIEQNESYVSKIIDTKYNEVAFSELNIGNKLLVIDENHNFFAPFVNACYFTPQKHNDIVYLKNNGRHISSSPDDPNISESIRDDDDSDTLS
jgi:hypothetical protein